MKKIISCINKKGGCSKTTTVMALADALAIAGEKILVVDLDSQMNMSLGYGNFHLSKKGIYNFITEQDCNFNEIIKRVPNSYFMNLKVKGYVDVLPSNSFTDRLQEELIKYPKKEERLLRSLQRLDGSKYDYIIIDTAPLPITDIVITNVMVASDEIIVPTKLEPFASTGVELIYPRIKQMVNEGLNPELKIAGILLTQVMGRRERSNQPVNNELLAYTKPRGLKIYDSTIRNLENAVFAQIQKHSVFCPKTFEKSRIVKGEIETKKFFRTNPLAKDYIAFAEEYLKDNGSTIDTIEIQYQ